MVLLIEVMGAESFYCDLLMCLVGGTCGGRWSLSCRLVGGMGPPSLVCCLAWRGRCLSQLSLLHLPDSPGWLWQPHWRKRGAGKWTMGMAAPS